MANSSSMQSVEKNLKGNQTENPHMCFTPTPNPNLTCLALTQLLKIAKQEQRRTTADAKQSKQKSPVAEKFNRYAEE